MTAQPVERYCPSCERSFHEGQRCPDDGTELVVIAERPDPMLGRSLNDRYTVIARLGSGGMGTVYRGTQHSVGREVAIKVVSAALVAEPDAIKRFLREAKLASRLSHPNAVSVLDFGQTSDGVFYLVMELLSGTTLDKLLRTEGRLRLPRVTRIGQQVCDALEGAHRLAIIHRDLKPANVMLLDGSEGRDLIKVLDFGLAKSLSKDSAATTVTVSGALLGTPAYMSPEAAIGGEVDERSDLYSLGCMLYALASGRPPFQSDKMHELLSMQANTAPPPIMGIPAPVAAVIMKLLAKDPSSRFRTAAATRHALDEAAAPYISRDLETANANTLPGRKKSMPPVVATSAATIADESIGSTKPAPRTAPATAIDEMGPTLTPPPTQPAARPAEPVVARSTKRVGWIVAGALIVLAVIAGVFVTMRGGDDPPPARERVPVEPVPGSITSHPEAVAPPPVPAPVEVPPPAPIETGSDVVAPIPAKPAIKPAKPAIKPKPGTVIPPVAKPDPAQPDPVPTEPVKPKPKTPW